MKSFISIIVAIFFGLYCSAQTLDCRLIEAVGNAPEINPILLEKISEMCVGDEYDGLTNLKKITIISVEELSFTGCKATIKVNIEMDRKVRRDAKGYLIIKGDVIEAKNLLSVSAVKSICLGNAKITKVKVNKTLRIGEKFYKWAANKVFPNNQCYEWR